MKTNNINKFKKLWYKYYYEPIYIDKLFHNLNLLGANFPIFPDGSSGNAGLLYSILKLLHAVNPKNILELGTGQSSYIFNLYCGKNPNTNCLSIENDLSWHNLLSEKLSIENHEFCHIPLLEHRIELEKTSFQANFYDLSKLDKRFNLILLDGPFGGNNRFGFIKYLESIIDLQDFILIIDDTNRKSELNLARLIEEKLKNELGIDIVSYSVYGSKHQRIVLSPNNSFLLTI